MSRCCRIALMLLLCGSIGNRPSSAQNGSGSYGPEVRSFLELMRHEEDELEFQIKHNEINRKEYTRAKSCIAIHRQTVLNLVRETGQDSVPEIHVVAAAELDQLIENGTSALKGLKRGEVIRGKWKYLGSLTRGEVFHIFERLQNR
jgi:hypothetical protein